MRNNTKVSENASEFSLFQFAESCMLFQIILIYKHVDVHYIYLFKNGIHTLQRNCLYIDI
jgi:hypothetical protein